MHSDLQSLSHYHQRGDALAFRELVHSHSGMVLATARRITRDEAMAEDVAQETFVKLARQSKTVTESVAAWLHRVASRLACNAVRDDSTRRKNEENSAATEEAFVAPKESPWSDVEPLLDTVIDELPEGLRAPLVLHFLKGLSQRDIARELKVSQPTVSRAIDAGLVELRKRLSERGVLCGAGLGALLLAQSATAAPVPTALLASMCKIGMTGIGGNSMLPAAAAGLSAALLLKMAAVLMITVGVVAVGATTFRSSAKPELEAATSASVPVTFASATTGHSTLSSPQRSRTSGSPTSGALSMSGSAPLPVMPVHELVHSFPQTLQRPFGAMVLVDGWVWGTTLQGGEYGCGTVFKAKPDGSEWHDVFVFRGRVGSLRGQSPRGIILAHDGVLWGTTESGGESNAGTLYRVDRATEELITVVDFDSTMGVSPGVAVAEAADGSIWGTTSSTVFRFQPARNEWNTVSTFTGVAGVLPGARALGGLATDGKGLLWGTTLSGGVNDMGTLFKVDTQARKVVNVAQFTGTRGALPGNGPEMPPTPDGRGVVWGVTKFGGVDDGGVIFKFDVGTNTCRAVAEFRSKNDQRVGTNPMAALAVDDDGNVWGSTRFLSGYSKGGGNVFKLDRNSERVTTEIDFTARGGAYPGGPLRGPMLSDGAGGFIGVCNFGGVADFGTMFHLDVKTHGFTLLRDLADLASSKDGADPRGRLVAGTDGALWGVAENSGAEHCGIVFKVDPITDSLVTVADFTGNSGAKKGSHPRAGLTSDGHGFMWGVTTGGGINERGTVYKIEERTGAFHTVYEFGLPTKRSGPAGSGPETELVDDHKGYLWGTTKSAVYKLNMSTGAMKVVANFSNSTSSYHGTEPEALTLDDHGFIWGAAFGEPRRISPGTIFKINTTSDAITVVENLTDARRGTSSITYRQGDMYADGKGSVWFAGAYARDFNYATRTLVKINAGTGNVEGWYRQPEFSQITTPVMDDRGLLWGLSGEGGAHSEGSVYCFDPATNKFTTVMEFTGVGPQAKAGEQPERTRFFKHSDGNLYAGTRYGGPGNGGTLFRLRFGPTPMTQEATLLADGSAELHGTLRPNGRDSEAAYEWGTDVALSDASTVSAGIVKATDSVQSVTTRLTGLKPSTTYYFRLRGKNDSNRIAQLGAVRYFTTPSAGLASTNDASDDVASASRQPSATGSMVSIRLGLTVVRIPGAGAGFVRGALEGAAYELGKHYTLTAQADNDYIFSRWSGPGITGGRAENRQLSFVFTEELAKAPVITATFVKNPFHEGVTGVYTGLVLTAEGMPPDISNTGATRLTVTNTGNFSGELRYARRKIPLVGAFDSGGLARFGTQHSPSLIVPAATGEKPLLIALQLDLSASESSGIGGTIALLEGKSVKVQSVIQAERGFYDGHQHKLPAEYMADGGRYPLMISDASTQVSGTLQLATTGSAVFAGKLKDGAAVLIQAPLSQTKRAAFFSQLYAHSQGSFGGEIVLGELFGNDSALHSQPFWWCQPEPGPAWQDITVEWAGRINEQVK